MLAVTLEAVRLGAAGGGVQTCEAIVRDALAGCSEVKGIHSLAALVGLAPGPKRRGGMPTGLMLVVIQNSVHPQLTNNQPLEDIGYLKSCKHFSNAPCVEESGDTPTQTWHKQKGRCKAHTTLVM